MNEENSQEEFKTGFYFDKTVHGNSREWAFTGGIQKEESDRYFNGYDNLPTHYTKNYEVWINVGRKYFILGYRKVRRVNINN